jgi:hypothetical protein
MIAVVVPTIREEKLKEFLLAWTPLFKKHNVNLYVVRDGKKPTVNGESVKSVMGKYSNLIYNFNDGVRNLGFAKAYKDGADIFISLDDDVLPEGDPIQDHLDILNTKQPVSWINTVDEIFMRGMPYNVRTEAKVVLSHGLWKGVYDMDASTQLVLGIQQPQHRKMVIPKGIFYPMCIMNCAFTRELAPYFYQAPAYGDIQRFSDIFCGIESKKVIDEKGWAVASGYVVVNHNRASNPFVNLVKEARGVGMNENFWKNEIDEKDKQYFDNYKKCREQWLKFIKQFA